MKPYLVCATPRSGSTSLCDLLAATGVAGRPQEFFERLYATNLPRQPREYFVGLEDEEVLERLPPLHAGTPESAEAFEQRLADALRAGATDNGVWAAKLMWGYLPALLRRLAEREPGAKLRPHAAFDRIWPGVRYVHVRRRDKVAQAGSLWALLQEGEPVYSAAAIRFLLKQVDAQDRGWIQWFAGVGIEPITIHYEDFVEDPPETALHVLDELGIDRAEAAQPATPAGLDNERAEEWAHRFQAERGRLVA